MHHSPIIKYLFYCQSQYYRLRILKISYSFFLYFSLVLYSLFSFVIFFHSILHLCFSCHLENFNCLCSPLYASQWPLFKHSFSSVSKRWVKEANKHFQLTILPCTYKITQYKSQKIKQPASKPKAIRTWRLVKWALLWASQLPFSSQLQKSALGWTFQKHGWESLGTSLEHSEN